MAFRNHFKGKQKTNKSQFCPRHVARERETSKHHTISVICENKKAGKTQSESINELNRREKFISPRSPLASLIDVEHEKL